MKTFMQCSFGYVDAAAVITVAVEQIKQSMEFTTAPKVPSFFVIEGHAAGFNEYC